MPINAQPGQLTRQELYDKIRESSKDEYILSEMKRLGFWKVDEQQPTEAEAMISRRSELQKQLNGLVKKERTYSDPEEALKALRVERMKAAREKRAETRKKQADDRYQKALDWHNKQKEEISWLGEAVSLGLQKQGLQEQGLQGHALKAQDLTDQAALSERLQNHALPEFASHKALAEAMGITLNELRFLAYDRVSSKVSHYKQFLIAKKTGGFRKISAPMPRLKRSQYWVLDNILAKIPLHDAAHGFVGGRSILTNAAPHVGKDVVLNLDLKDFFPTITYRRVKGLFHKAGYSEAMATVLGLLCCEPDVEEVALDGENWFVQKGERHLPQGAPTSPAISNLLCRALDRRLVGLAKKHGFNYTRYADDLTFSGDGDARRNVKKLLWGIQNIVEAEGFVLHPDKTRIMRKGAKQEVTGLVVNDRLSVDRTTLKKFRALLYQAGRDGLEGKIWNASRSNKALLRSMLGYANFVAMVHPEKGAKFKTEAKAIAAAHKGTFETEKHFNGVRKAKFRALSARGLEPLEDWKQAGEKPEPVREKTRDELAAERQTKLAAKREEKQAAVNAARAQNNDSGNPWLGRQSSGGGFAGFSRAADGRSGEGADEVSGLLETERRQLKKWKQDWSVRLFDTVASWFKKK